MYCVQCGSAAPPENKFCNQCGAAIRRSESVSPNDRVPQPSTHLTPDAPGAAQAAFQTPPPPSPPPTYQAIPQPIPFPPPMQGVPQPVYPSVPPPVHSIPQAVYYVAATPQPQTVQQINLLHSLQSRLQRIASTEDLQGFSLKQMFSDVFKRRTNAEVEDYILVGTSKTTPVIDLVETGWPKPWLFFRVLATMVVAYVALTFTLMRSGNPNLIPGVMIIGAFAVPLATLTFFFEMNSPRNVSIHRIATLFLLGAVVSLVFALIGYTLPLLGVLGNMAAGIVEEVAKLLTVVIVVRSVRYKYILNGLLFGATVGAGFAAFETAGYALNQGLLPSGVIGMLQILRERAFLTPWGHVAWTAIAAGAFWRVKRDQVLSASMLFDSRFLKAFMIPVVLHMIWDAPWQLPFDGNYILSAVVSWYVVFGLVQQGLRQVQEDQRAHLQTTLATVEASMQTQGTVGVT